MSQTIDEVVIIQKKKKKKRQLIQNARGKYQNL